MKKIFTVKRAALLMSLIFIYSFAFMFVKIYAEKSILTDKDPAAAAIGSLPELSGEVDSADDAAENEQPAVTEPSEPISEETLREPVEYIINKQDAGQYPMLGLGATNVPDEIEIVTEPKTEVTTAPSTTEAPTTTSKETEETKKTEKTEAPKSEETEQPKDETSEEISPEDVDEDEPTEDVEDSSEEYVDEEDNPFIEMSEEEMKEFLESLGLYSEETDTPAAASPAPTNPDDVLVSSKSYKDEVVTIYDTKQQRFRTENAFDLVCEITYHEIGNTKDPEATKAQAIAAYSYIKHYEQLGDYAKIGTKSDVPQSIIDCVNEIDGLAMFYGDEYIMAAFSSSTGGYSASSKNVWGGDRPYLQSVKNDYDYLDTKNYGKVTTYTVDEVREAIESNTDIKLSDNYSDWIRILSYSDSIYADQLSIDGHTTAYINGRERDITGYNFRMYILNIRSTVFTVSYADGVFTFTTYGYGHGVGMSQTGANLYAIYGGYTFDQILHHYYTGVTIR